MRQIETYQLETVLAGERIACERIEYARELRRVADANSPYTHAIQYELGYFMVGRVQGLRTANPFGDAGRSGKDRRSGEDRRRPLRWAETWQDPDVEHPSAPVTPPGAPCGDCTQEAAAYRAIPVDEVTVEFVFLKSRRFLGGPTEAEILQLHDDALAENPSLDYAEVVVARERHKFELSAGDRLRTREVS